MKIWSIAQLASFVCHCLKYEAIAELSASVSVVLAVVLCVLFLFHTTRQWLVMVKFSLARSRWREPSVPHVHVWEIYWPPSTHAQSVNSLKLRSAVALRSGGHCRCCFNSNLAQVAFELNASFSKREPVDLPTFFSEICQNYFEVESQPRLDKLPEKSQWLNNVA